MMTSRAKEAAPPGRLLPPDAAAEHLGGIKIGTLAKWRHFGMGPPYIKIGARVMYHAADLDAWIGARRRQSTSESADE